MMVEVDNKQELDQEWIELIKEAKNLGLSLEEIRDFLYHN